MDKKRKNIKKREEIEDATAYGEFISSFDNWITMDNQRKRVNKIEKLTEEKDK
ncbi:MAG: hypothetical protein ACM3KR_04365 [Deltaproteobacteria bacterium]